MSCVAIIPARGGSEGVPRKNLRLVAGQPLIAYIIVAAKSATKLQSIIVSTEDDEIAEVAKGMDVEVLRHDKRLSTGSEPSFGVVRSAIKELNQRQIKPEMCVLLRATAPLCRGDDIDSAITLLEANEKADSVVSVTRMWGVHPKKLKSLGSNCELFSMFEPEGYVPTRRQELPPLYIRNGAIYVSRPSLILNGKLWGPHCLGYVMPEERSVNINSELDFKLAEVLIKEKIFCLTQNLG